MMTLTRRIRNYFLTGLVVLAPVGLTIYIIWGLFQIVDNLLDDTIRWLISQRLGPQWGELYIPGLGFIAVMLIIFLTGIIARNFFGRKLIKWGD